MKKRSVGHTKYVQILYHNALILGMVLYFHIELDSSKNQLQSLCDGVLLRMKVTTWKSQSGASPVSSQNKTKLDRRKWGG